MLIATRNVTVNCRPRPIILTKGAKVTKAIYNRLTQRQRADYVITVGRRPGTGDAWCTGELDLMAHLYHTMTDAANNNENADAIVAAFMAQYDTRSRAAIIMVIAQCKAIDSLYDAKGLNYNNYLATALAKIDAERYIG